MELNWVWLSKNLIAQAEFRHQRFIIETNRSNPMVIVLATIILMPGILLSIIAFVLALFNLKAVAQWDFLNQPIPSLIMRGFFLSNVVMNIALYFVLMLIGIALAYNSISREYSRKTWDVLCMTNVSARYVVLGKWWASFVALWGDHMMLVILRVGLACLALLLAPENNTHFLIVLSVALILVVFTLVDVGFTIALAIASALSGAKTVLSSALVIGVRFIGIFVASGIYFLMLLFIMQDRLGDFYLISLGLIALFGILTAITLRLAEWIGVHWGALNT
jgi:ABC-type transport system involved in multi-copper enzyme maturation permease subunit